MTRTTIIAAAALTALAGLAVAAPADAAPLFAVETGALPVPGIGVIPGVTVVRLHHRAHYSYRTVWPRAYYGYGYGWRTPVVGLGLGDVYVGL